MIINRWLSREPVEYLVKSDWYGERTNRRKTHNRRKHAYFRGDDTPRCRGLDAPPRENATSPRFLLKIAYPTNCNNLFALGYVRRHSMRTSARSIARCKDKLVMRCAIEARASAAAEKSAANNLRRKFRQTKIKTKFAVDEIF